MFKFNEKINQYGFTLIEMLVSMGIFSVVIAISVGAFVGGSNYQRKTLELFSVQREAGYIMERISRELRMATDLSEFDSASNNQKGQHDDYLEFTDSSGKKKIYCRSDINDNCDVNGKFFGVGEENSSSTIDYSHINSSDVEIESLEFDVNNFDSTHQRYVTIFLKLKSTGKYNTLINLQSSISMRIY